MKAKEFIIENKAGDAVKPRNFVAKNAMKTTSGAGAHKDKKRAEKQGDVKHKKDRVPMEGFTKADADRNKAKHQKSGRKGHGLDWKDYNDDYKTLVSDIVNKFDNITRIVQYADAPEPTKYKIVERFFKKYGYPFELFNDVIIGIEKRAAGETSRFNNSRVSEVSKSTLDRYVSKAVDAHGDADFSARMSKNDPDKRSYHVDQKKTAEKRRQGISRALDRMSKEGVSDSSDSEELANEVYAEFERTYPNLARRADERTIHSAIIDVLNYGGDSDPSALAQDVARAVKRDIQSVAEGVVSEKAVSKQQQKFMGMVHAAKKGETPASPEVAKVAAGMSKKAAKDFAATKHKGLPKKKGVSEGVFDMFKSKPLPKEPETIKLGKFEVALTPGNKYIGFAWKDSSGKEHYEEVSTRGEEFGANNRNELIAKIKDEIKYQEKQIKQGVAEGEGGFDIEDMVMDQYRNGNDVWEIAQYLGIGEDEVQDIIDSNEKGVAEATPETTVSALRGYKTWQVWIKNNYYNGKYPDYSGRPYRVIAGSADEARQVVLDNADRVLKDLLSKKFPSGKRVLPPKSALPVEAKHIGAVDDGTMKGQITTSKPITMLSPQGPMTVMLDAGNIVDVERDVEEGKKPEHNLGTGWMLAKDKELGKKVAQNTEKARREKEMMQKYAGKKDVSEEQKIAELSSELMARYKKGASADATAADQRGDYKQGDKRFSGIVKATKKQFANDLKGKK